MSEWGFHSPIVDLFDQLDRIRHSFLCEVSVENCAQLDSFQYQMNHQQWTVWRFGSKLLYTFNEMQIRIVSIENCARVNSVEFEVEGG